MKRILLAPAAIAVFAEAAWSVTFSAEGTVIQVAGDVISEGAYTLVDSELRLTPAGEEAESVCGGWSDLDIGESTTTTDCSADGSEITITRTA